MGKEFANSVITTVINGTWSKEETELFLSKLTYNPYTGIAIGGLSSINSNKINAFLETLAPFNFEKANKLHFLGCGGIKKAQLIKQYGYSGNNISVDCSTYINRAIDGSTNGKTQSGYFDYNSKRMIRISHETKEEILYLHGNFQNPLFSCDEMEDILNTVLLHQSNYSSNETYDARAKLIVHNADVFRHNIED